ncbi:MAG: hypothetical protein KDB68_00465 [Planctomycetes bacterium]|nr:hypothetical protein [Planctomycetota bacterium]
MEPEAATVHPLRCAFFYGMLFGTLALFVVAVGLPIAPAGRRDAPLAEGEQLSHSAGNTARVLYAKSGKLNRVLDTKANVSPLLENFSGSYYYTVNVIDYIAPDEAAIYTIPAEPGRPLMRMKFHWESGHSEREYLGPFE